MDNKLKLCPFCGGNGVAQGIERNGKQCKCIACDKCYVRTFPSNTIEEAINAWNVRM